MTSLLDWLGGEHDLGERLELIDNLCRALEAFHERAPGVRPALDPSRVELTPDLGVSLAAADPNEDGFQVPEYRAPEIVAGVRYTPTSGTYSAAVLCYEALAGRHPFVMDTPLGPVEASADAVPTPLSELRRELPRDLADAIMPCLERDPEWRPKDLSYLLETLRQARAAVPSSKGRRAPVKPAPKAAAPKAAAPKAAPAAAPAAPREPQAPREAGALPGRPPAKPSRVPLFAAAGAGLLAVVGGLWYVTKPAAQPAGPLPVASRAPASAAPLAAATAAPEAPPSVAPTPAAEQAGAGPVDTASLATPTPEAPPTPVAVAAAPTPVPATPTPLPRATAAPVVEPARPTTPVSTPAPTAAPVATGPIAIAALVPSKLRRGPTVLLDVRGSGLRPGLEARILFKGREAAAGVYVVSQHFVDPGLLRVMLRIDAQAKDGSYALTLGDASGVSNPRTFEVGR